MVYSGVLDAVNASFASIIAIIPNILGAIIIFVIGLIVGGISKSIALELLKVVQLEPFAEKVGLTENLKRLGSRVSPAELLANLVKWTVVIIFLSPAAEVLGLDQISVLVQGILAYIPNVIVAVIILMFGAIIADLSADFVKGAAAALASSTANFLGGLARYAILIFSFLAALSQLKIAAQLVNTLFTGLVAMLAIAGGLAFGLGGKELASEILENIRSSLSEKHE